MDTTEKQQITLTLDQYAEVLAHIVHFGAEDRYELMGKLGVSPQDWEIAEAHYLEYLALAERRNQALATMSFANAYAKSRRRLSYHRPEFASLSSLFEREGKAEAEAGDDRSTPPAEAAVKAASQVSAPNPLPGMNFASHSGGMISPWVDRVAGRDPAEVHAAATPMPDARYQPTYGRTSIAQDEPHQQIGEEPNIDETAFVREPVVATDPLVFRKIAPGEAVAPPPAVRLEPSDEIGQTSVLGVPPVLGPALPFINSNKPPKK